MKEKTLKFLEKNLSSEPSTCSPQYVSKILSGHTNFSFKSIAEIEKCLNIRIMETSFA